MDDGESAMKSQRTTAHGDGPWGPMGTLFVSFVISRTTSDVPHRRDPRPRPGRASVDWCGGEDERLEFGLAAIEMLPAPGDAWAGLVATYGDRSADVVRFQLEALFEAVPDDTSECRNQRAANEEDEEDRPHGAWRSWRWSRSVRSDENDEERPHGPPWPRRASPWPSRQRHDLDGYQPSWSRSAATRSSASRAWVSSPGW